MPDFVTETTTLLHPTGGTTTLLLVRHGQTTANASGLFAGALDVPLDELGQHQARQLGEAFRSIPIDVLISSPLQRARETARPIAEVTHLEPVIEPGFAEINFGEAEGLTIFDIVQQWPDIIPLLMDIDDMTLTWPGGERRSEFHARVLSTILATIERYTDKRVAAVCHGGVISSVMAHLEDGHRNDYKRYHVSNCSITQLEVRGDKTIVHSWDDVSHLNEVLPSPWATLQEEDNA